MHLGADCLAQRDCGKYWTDLRLKPCPSLQPNVHSLHFLDSPMQRRSSPLRAIVSDPCGVVVRQDHRDSVVLKGLFERFAGVSSEAASAFNVQSPRTNADPCMDRPAR